MNKKMRELKAQIAEKKAKAKELANENKITDAKAMIKEINDLQDRYEIEEELFNSEKDNEKDKGKEEPKATYNAELFTKVVKGAKLTDAENALLTTGANGENLLIPKDVSTKIYELKRQYKSAKNLIGYYPTTTLEGSYPIETLDTLTELVNFTESEDVPESDAPKFVNVEYKIKEYGGILPLSNTLLKNETSGLVTYLGRWFAKKAVRTENKLIFAKLKDGKEAKAIDGMDGLAEVINVDLDPAVSVGAVIVTNQDGFHYMDMQEDKNGRKLLQQDPTNPTRKLYKGLPIEVFSNAELKTTTNKVPVFVGDLQEGVDFVDRESLEFAMSSEAGFKQNKTYIRVIESIDITAKDKSAYVYGEIDITPAV